MRSLSAAFLALLVGCSSGPPAPTLPQTLTLRRVDYEESGGILPITGILELVIEPSGEAKSSCLRQILTNVDRAGELSREQLIELVSRVDAWTAKPGVLPPAKGNNYGLLVYGDKKAAWQKDDKLPPELESLVNFLLSVPPTLSTQTRRR
jgi:hypothetical protein